MKFWGGCLLGFLFACLFCKSVVIFLFGFE